jgi:serine/threonine protein kinase
MSFVNGENVGPYRIISQLGQGGMATVYKAYHPALDRYVAIKALHPAFMEDKGFLARFEREAKVVAKLEHPNIVPIYHAAEHGGRPYLVMKYIEGETLKARLTRGSLNKDEVIRIVTAVGEALSYAHKDNGQKEKILHRDIKPSNVLLAQDGQIYLTDFGLARIAEAGASTLSGDMLMGTPHYISPEQARGERNLDERTDIYSFGIVLYEILMDRVPFTADTPFSIIHDHIYSPLPLPREIKKDFPELLQNVIIKSLAKEPDERFESVEKMVSSFLDAYMGIDVEKLPSRVEKKDVRESAATGPPPVTKVADDPPIVKPEIAQPIPEPGAPTPLAGPKFRKQWLWVIGGVLLACLVLLTFLSAINNADSGSEPGLLNRPPSDDAQDMNRPEDEFPDDPGRHLERADELINNGAEVEASMELVIAADIFLKQGDFVSAADVYTWALELRGEPLRGNVRVLAKLTQALFLGAPDPALWPLIEGLYEEFPEREMILIIGARAKLHAGRFDEAMRDLDEVLERKPDNPFARAVFTEQALMNGDFDGAEEMIRDLLSGDLPVPWLRMYIEDLEHLFP